MSLLLIVGITGLLGQRLAQAALDNRMQVRGLGRSPRKLTTTMAEQLESFIQSDNYYDIPALDRAVTGVDAVICAYQADPVLNLDGCLLLLRAAERAGVKTFVAPTWNSNWSSINFGDFELYNSVLAFLDHAAATSPIKPAYIITGFFADYLLLPGMGPFESDGKSAKLHYWGDLHKRKIPWTPMDDAAAWTIELLKQPDVVAGNGGIFKFQSGVNTLEELAVEYERVTGVAVELVKDGSAEDLHKELQASKNAKGRAGWREYLWLSWCNVALQGKWEFQNPPMAMEATPSTFGDVLAKRNTY
ncbi:uncharacterized protein FFB20_10355 [Fusarium fujikuroi]|uniref:NmrA-like domain-containing protein n=1 Tax=Gibberella fujikuroi (strain CBS 195.34 / IMI 58289 / NRRL A-6831) TaxID=1279085 RepID=S0EMZ2_GIBF5|nr:uncharacterized protein FFUJ_12071 [Fusarium fujikuroi IMI 58289]KLP04337.1 uncharacterized protein Y057_466 [Fusarium fujikuroi]KLP15628.1 uncharacterized protein LW94_11012 [Fusarium fujikuroi]QGI71266.1 hypothetical protein CEK27_003595 [Fusarium fujikuroi]QGJ02159.1 hypothetical protein CEK26_003603 [Fusarium fujikuroi]CCT76012.1 uncharacterized protein FFUJ_12071 [Fusarium fujikuroi IMI 58289]